MLLIHNTSEFSGGFSDPFISINAVAFCGKGYDIVVIRAVDRVGEERGTVAGP